jgi:hypothetical protein
MKGNGQAGSPYPSTLASVWAPNVDRLIPFQDKRGHDHAVKPKEFSAPCNLAL